MMYESGQIIGITRATSGILRPPGLHRGGVPSYSFLLIATTYDGHGCFSQFCASVLFFASLLVRRIPALRSSSPNRHPTLLTPSHCLTLLLVGPFRVTIGPYCLTDAHYRKPPFTHPRRRRLVEKIPSNSSDSRSISPNQPDSKHWDLHQHSVLMTVNKRNQNRAERVSTRLL